MDDYPSNSHKRAKPVTAPDEAPKKIEKIVEGEVVRRKKPLGKRFTELFVSGDSRTVGQYILFDILLPAAKDTIADVVTQGIERTLWGEARSTSRRNGNRPGTGSHVSYGTRFQASNNSYGRPEPRAVPSRRARATHDFDEIILQTRVVAEEVIDNLFMLVSKYESASVADLYELVGIQGTYTDDKWGWVDLRGAGVTRVNGGYLLDLPKPEPLD